MAMDLNYLVVSTINDMASYMGIIISHYKDPYETTSIKESSKGFFRGSSEKICSSQNRFIFPKVRGKQSNHVWVANT